MTESEVLIYQIDTMILELDQIIDDVNKKAKEMSTDGYQIQGYQVRDAHGGWILADVLATKGQLVASKIALMKGAT